MASFLNSTTLVDSVKRRSSIPLAQVTFQDVDLLAFANEEMLISVVPSVLQLHQEYFVYTQVVPLLPNQSTYDLPSRALADKLRVMFYKDTSGNLFEMTRIFPEDVPFFSRSMANTPTFGYYFENDSVVLVPEVTANPVGSLVMKYYCSPSSLVTSDSVAIITSIDRNTGDVGVSSIPTGWTTGSTYDLLEMGNAHRTLTFDVVPNSVNSTTKVINITPALIPASWVAGDYIAKSRECFVPQIPDALHPLLAERIAARCIDAQGDLQALQAANSKLTEMERKLGILIDNRSTGNPQKAIATHGTLRTARISRRIF